jgi:hypothetical protein
MSVAIQVAPPSSLGAYAAATESHPVATLTATGAIVGALWGALLGYGVAKLARSDKTETWVLGTSAVGAALMGVEGYKQGTETSTWLQQF